MNRINFALEIRPRREGESGWPAFSAARDYPIVGHMGNVTSLDEALKICRDGCIARLNIDRVAHEQMVLAGVAPMEPWSCSVRISICPAESD